MYNPRNANPHTPAFVNQRFQHEVDPRYLLNLHYAPVTGGYYSYHAPNGPAMHGIPTYAPVHPQVSIGGLPSMTPPRGPRELDGGHSLRSALLEDYKANHKTRRYELKVEYSKTVIRFLVC
jgi:hypothetical protein